MANHSSTLSTTKYAVYSHTIQAIMEPALPLVNTK
ncbi:hypothetical protein LCGC14_2074100 [marine sediment metagenome]|uniref:Uncharacterized protein n=1 Tax=marine sediment metagenome TaxID=412755 RepID=A0A0F9F4U9_9ZZZZ